MGASFSLPKQFVNGEVLTHTDLNAQFNTILDNVAVASGIASLDGSALVVQDPTNATATKAAGKICKWGASEAFQCSALTATTGAFSGQITNTVADGTAPLVITSTTEVANLKSATSTLATTATTATNLAITGEASATSATSPVTLNLGTVTAGDRIYISSSANVTLPNAAATSYAHLSILISSGTATFVFQNNHAGVDSFATSRSGGTNTFNQSCGDILQVTGNGTLVMQATMTKDGSTTLNNIQIYAFFLKKQ